MLYLLARLQISFDDGFELLDNLEVLNNLLERYGIDSRIDTLINYLFQPVASVKVAGHIIKQLKSELNSSKACFELDLPESIDVERIDFLKRVSEINLTSSKYKEALSDETMFRYHMATETSFGLSGLLGSLILLEGKLSGTLLEEGLDRVKQQLVETDSGRALSIGDNCASPYFSNGNAGYIKALLYLNKDSYREEIISLAKSFNFEFAQRADYDDGMLGISDCLLDLYDLEQNKTYLDLAENLLLNTSFYVNVDKISISDFLAVSKKYKELINDSTAQEK